MEQTPLQKILKNGKKIIAPITLLETLHKQITDLYNKKNERELFFLSQYYGLIGQAKTLEEIGEINEKNSIMPYKPITRERVRQIINQVLTNLKNPNNSYPNPYTITENYFSEQFKNNSFVRLDNLITNPFFSCFKNNTKGLISFLNDCNIKQTAYRKKYYFYPSDKKKKEIVIAIQKENKTLRHLQTLSKMSVKVKSVTYVPNEVRTFLSHYAQRHNLLLNPLYENILIDFIKEKPYLNKDYVFSKTKSWKARNGTVQWQQIGIYINHSIVDSIKKEILKIKKETQHTVSFMSFIYQGFFWHYHKNQNLV